MATSADAPRPQLKTFFDRRVVEGIADAIARVHRGFDRAGFVREAMDGLDRLELTPRAWRIAHALRRRLPADFPGAAAIVERSLGAPLPPDGIAGMAPFSTCRMSSW